MTTPMGVCVFFVAQPPRLVRVAQHPGANRAPDTSLSFGIVVEKVCQMVVCRVVVKAERLMGMLESHGKFACITVANAGKCVSRD